MAKSTMDSERKLNTLHILCSSSLFKTIGSTPFSKSLPSITRKILKYLLKHKRSLRINQSIKLRNHRRLQSLQVHIHAK
jgi:hypothetical protein